MAQGKKYNDDLKERAFALLACNNSVAYVANELGLPYSTVKTWEKKFLAQSKELERREAEGSQTDEVTKPNEELDLAKLRRKKKEEFIEDSWNLIGKVETLLERRLNRAIGSEDVIDTLLEEILALDHKELTDQQRKSLYTRISALKIENVKELAVVLGTLYDKQALANKEATQIVDNSVTIKFEDL